MRLVIGDEVYDFEGNSMTHLIDKVVPDKNILNMDNLSDVLNMLFGNSIENIDVLFEHDCYIEYLKNKYILVRDIDRSNIHINRDDVTINRVKKSGLRFPVSFKMDDPKLLLNSNGTVVIIANNDNNYYNILLGDI